MLTLALMGQSCGVSSGTNGPGGIFYSSDQGATWQARSSAGQNEQGVEITIQTLNISQLVMSPLDSQVLYAVTGQAGLWRSLNSGQLWQRIVAKPVTKLVLHPTDQEIMYLVSGQSVWRSQDSAHSWALVYAEATAHAQLLDLAIDSVDHNIIYVATSNGLVLLRTENEGATWQRQNIFLRPIVKLVVSPVNQSVIYAAEKDGVIWRTSDSGQTWAPVTEELKKEFGLRRLGTFRELIILPKSDSLVYVNSQGLYTSPNGGETWQEKSLLTAPAAVDITSLVINPQQTNNIMYTAGGVLFTTTDDGLTWSTELLPTSLPVSSLLIDPNNTQLMYISLGR